MGELASRIAERIRTARAAVRQAEETGDDFGAQIHRGELDNLRRIARLHGITVPEQAAPARPEPAAAPSPC